jgi:lysophospholipase L1-like esterase
VARPSPWRSFALAALLLAMLCVAPAPAPAQEPAPPPSTLPPLPATGCDVGPITNFLAADATQPGVINLIFFGAQGASVEFFECVDDTLRPLGTLAGPPDEGTQLLEATQWDCARASRSFVARALLPDGTLVAGAYAVRTGSCASRFEVRVPTRVAEGKVARVRVVDGWGIGDYRPRLCIAPPRGDKVCSVIGFKKAVTIRTRRFRAKMAGRWRVELRVGDHKVKRTIAVGGAAPSKPPAVVLATGDSTMQGVDNFLADELGDDGTVRSDIRVGTGIGKSDWQAIADAQVKRYKPRFTVMSLGVNEGFPMTTPAGTSVECCDEPWIAEYVRRVRAMMATYRRKGDGRVLWLTLPLPRDGGPRTASITAVNSAIVRAGEGMKGVSILRMDEIFTPNGFAEVIRYRGRYIRVRTADGIHLNVSGTAIAAKVIAAAIRKMQKQ